MSLASFEVFRVTRFVRGFNIEMPLEKIKNLIDSSNDIAYSGLVYSIKNTTETDVFLLEFEHSDQLLLNHYLKIVIDLIATTYVKRLVPEKDICTRLENVCCTVDITLICLYLKNVEVFFVELGHNYGVQIQISYRNASVLAQLSGEPSNCDRLCDYIKKSAIEQAKLESSANVYLLVDFDTLLNDECGLDLKRILNCAVGQGEINRFVIFHRRERDTKGSLYWNDGAIYKPSDDASKWLEEINEIANGKHQNYKTIVVVGNINKADKKRMYELQVDRYGVELKLAWFYSKRFSNISGTDSGLIARDLSYFEEYINHGRSSHPDDADSIPRLG